MMPHIFDNIERELLPALTDTIDNSARADFCVGYFNLRGWKQLDHHIERWPGGPGNCCRLLIGMQRPPEETLREALRIVATGGIVDRQELIKIKKQVARSFRDQLTFGAPTANDESGLRRLARQLREKKVVVKLFLRHPLHAKLYLLFPPDHDTPLVGYLGSSNLTMAGLSNQGELNIDVAEPDACLKLKDWFEKRWDDSLCLDISQELIEIINESWAREQCPPPYQLYLKIAYHLSQEARAGLNEFRIPRDFGNRLFEFQTAAVKIAARHLNRRGGVIIGDVVGLGKTLMATALARVFEDDHDLETLIICPKNLVEMWEQYRQQYRLRAKVLSLSRVIDELAKLRRYRLVVIDESHNLRNRESRRYRAIQEYLLVNESRVIMLSATPYNKTYLDLANQLRLFIPEEKEIGLRPERYLREIGETEFIRRHQCSPRSIAAFEKSQYADDWRELMRLYLVRRTRSFIKDNYAVTDPATGRKYLTYADGTRADFPSREPKTVKYDIRERDASDQYAKLYAAGVVDTINDLTLPRYGLGNYIAPTPDHPPTQAEAKALDNLSRAGKRLKGFCRTNIFKRLESSGAAFVQSLERHILRNRIYLYALEHDQPLPIGTQDMGLLDTRYTDEDADDPNAESLFAEDKHPAALLEPISGRLRTDADFTRRAAEVYGQYGKQHKGRFKWLRANLFVRELAADLRKDAEALMAILRECGEWRPETDAKLNVLAGLLQNHGNDKVLIFTQFADTVRYLETQLKQRGFERLAGVTGDSDNPTRLAWRFSPVSNERRDQIAPADELRILVATDVLSEGQNLQDAAIVVNYDLPWAIIRLIQRAGRVDRIGQKHERILCYSFQPADGVERIIRLRARVRQRLRENAEVVGADEAFFEDDRNDQTIRDLFTEKAGILDGDDDTEVDLASAAYQIWKNAIDRNPELEKTVVGLPEVVYSTKPHAPNDRQPEGALVYVRTAEGTDALAWMDKDGRGVTESQYEILKAAECAPETPSLERHPNHHDLVRQGVVQIAKEEKMIGGQLGRPSGARFRTYERLMHYAGEVQGTLFDTERLRLAIEEIYRYPLRQAATDTLNRQLRSGVGDDALSQLVITLREEGRLCLVSEEERSQEPRIICSLGLRNAD